MLGFEESKKGIALNIVELAEAIQNRCGLLGNLDAISLLPHCTADELKEALREQVRAARIMKGRFIFGLGSPITPDTPLSRVREFVTLAREFGRL
jgi:uroporphyrinogen-III decarboxylase